MDDRTCEMRILRLCPCLFPFLCGVSMIKETTYCIFSGIYNSHIPWKKVTLVCYERRIQISNISSCSHLNKTCNIRLNVPAEPENITFGCSGEYIYLLILHASVYPYSVVII